MSEEQNLHLYRFLAEAGVAIDETERPLASHWAFKFEHMLDAYIAAGNRSRRDLMHAVMHRLVIYLGDSQGKGQGTGPWALDPVQGRAWVQAMLSEGLAPITVRTYTGLMTRVFQEMQPQKINPLRHAFPKIIPHAAQTLWLCQEEVAALLAAVDRHDSLIGKRDYALLLICLRTAQITSVICRLPWHTLHIEDSRLQVTWPRGKVLRQEWLPDDCAQALLDFLRASGRIEHIQPHDYLFPPVFNPSAPPAGAYLDWLNTGYLSDQVAGYVLAKYSDWAELHTRPLHMKDLRCTAIIQRFEAGASPDQIAAWLGARPKRVRQMLGSMHNTPVSPERRQAAERIWQKGPYLRTAPGAQPQLSPALEHGWYAAALPPAEVQTAKDQPLTLEDAIANLQAIMKRTLELALQCAAPQEALHALDIYSQATVRLAHALRLSRQLKQSQQEDLLPILQKAFQDLLAETGRGAKASQPPPPKI